MKTTRTNARRWVRNATFTTMALLGLLTAPTSLASGCGYFRPDYIARTAQTIFSGTVRSVGVPVRGRWGYVVPNTVEVKRVHRGSIREGEIVEVQTRPPFGWPAPPSAEGGIRFGTLPGDISIRLRVGEHVILALQEKNHPFSLSDNCSGVLTLSDLTFAVRYPAVAPTLLIAVAAATIAAMTLFIRARRLSRKVRVIAALLILVVGIFLVIRLLPDALMFFMPKYGSE